MRRLLLIVPLLMIALTLLASGEDDGHMHGPDGRHIVTHKAGVEQSSFILSHHDMRVEGTDGKSVLGVEVNSLIYQKGHADEIVHEEKNVYEAENEVYGSHMTYSEAGEYVLKQAIKLPDGREMAVEFPVFVVEIATASAPSDKSGSGGWPLYIGGGLAVLLLIYGSFRLGQRCPPSIGAGVLAALLVIGTTTPFLASASGADDGHAHGSPTDSEPAVKAETGSQLKAYVSAGKAESTEKVVDGIKFILSIENEEVAPDPDLVSMTETEAGLIGLKTAKVEVSKTAGGLQTTGRVSANPNGVVMVNSRGGGRVLKLGAIPGTEVKRGQMLAVIESPALADAQSDYRQANAEVKQVQAAIQIAESGLSASRTELEIAQSNLARQKQFAETGAFQNPALESARSKFSDAASHVEASQTRVKNLAALVEKLRQGLQSGVVSRREFEKAESDFLEAQSVLKDAQVQLGLAGAALKREEEIATRGLRNSKEVESAQSDVELAKAGRRSAQNRVTQAKADLARVQSAVRVAKDQVSILGGVPGGGNTISIHSPISAEVEHRFVSVGQTVATGEPLYDLLNADIVWILADIYEKDLKSLRIGQSIQVVADAHPDTIYRGEIAFIHNEVDPATRTTPVRIVIENPGERLKQNMFVRVILETAGQTSMLVPTAALQKDRGMDVVFTVEGNGLYRRKIVRVQGSVGNRTIVTGLDKGESIVTDGSYQLLSKGGGK